MLFSPFILRVQYLRAALGVRVTLQDVSDHGSVAFLHCPVEGGLSILMWKVKTLNTEINKQCQKYKKACVPPRFDK